MGLYRVTMQEHDTQTGGVEVVEVDYSCLWDPAKVGFEEIARAAAAERTCAYGFLPNGQAGTIAKVKCIGLSARTVEVEEELAEVANDG